MAKMNNPAERLRLLLEKGRDNKYNGKPAHVVWTELLRVDPPNRATLLSRLGKVYQLPGQVRAAIFQLPDIDDPEVYLTWMPKVEHALSSHNLDQSWQSVRAPIDDHVISTLAICSERLSHLRPEVTVPESELLKIRKQVTDLFDEIIKSSTISKSLSRFMLDHLLGILEAIDCYTITGTEPINTAIQSAVGSIPFEHDDSELLKDCPLARKFWTIVVGLSVAVSLLHDGTELAARWNMRALPPPLTQAATAPQPGDDSTFVNK
jgi:hypothetical protein